MTQQIIHLGSNTSLFVIYFTMAQQWIYNLHELLYKVSLAAASQPRLHVHAPVTGSTSWLRFRDTVFQLSCMTNYELVLFTFLVFYEISSPIAADSFTVIIFIAILKCSKHAHASMLTHSHTFCSYDSLAIILYTWHKHTSINLLLIILRGYVSFFPSCK